MEKLARGCEERPCLALTIGVLVAIAIRCWIAIFPHSGEGVPPMHGDFEAQRHWMEIATALPASDWYVNTTNNDLLYWGLDYPPLTAYHSLALGALGHHWVPECFRLGTSRGHESAACRRFMRASVVVSDLLVYLPGVAVAVHGLAPSAERRGDRVASILALWVLPPLLLIDHGHFQYNGVCFGLCLAAAGCVASGRTATASVLFTAGLFFKQIALYYAPGFFFGILALCLRRPPGSLTSGVGHVLATGCVVLGTAAAVFAPWLAGEDKLAAVLQVLHRMFPFARGLYEDKVANVWCSISVVIKLHRLIAPAKVPLVCALATLAALLPGCAPCLRRGAGGGTFVAALACSSFAFFLFSFQVHEKGVLFPCLAVSLLPVVLGPSRRPRWWVSALCHFQAACLFSMYPLVVKDGLQMVYGTMCLVLIAFFEATAIPSALRALWRSCTVLAVLLHAVHALAPPPPRYPDAWTLLITGSSCGYLVVCFCAITVAQLYGAFDDGGAWLDRTKAGKAE